MSEDLGAALARVILRLREAGVAHMVVGSVAALIHGRARSTVDVDIVIEPEARTLEAFVSSLAEEEFYVSREAATEALARRSLFNVIDFASGLKVDLIVRKDRPFSVEEFRRKLEVSAFDVEFQVATVEDTILSKLEWAEMGGGSARQLEDVAELIDTAGDDLDEAYIERWAPALGVMDAWRRLRAPG